MNCYRFCCTILTDNVALIVTVFAARLIAENAALLFTDYNWAASTLTIKLWLSISASFLSFFLGILFTLRKFQDLRVPSKSPTSRAARFFRACENTSCQTQGCLHVAHRTLVLELKTVKFNGSFLC